LAVGALGGAGVWLAPLLLLLLAAGVEAGELHEELQAVDINIKLKTASPARTGVFAFIGIWILLRRIVSNAGRMHKTEI